MKELTKSDRAKKIIKTSLFGTAMNMILVVIKMTVGLFISLFVHLIYIVIQNL